MGQGSVGGAEKARREIPSELVSSILKVIPNVITLKGPVLPSPL